MTKMKTKSNTSSTKNNGKTKKYRSEAAEALHSLVSDMHRAGTVDKETMRSFDRKCLIEPMSPKQIKALREKCRCSQRVFARYLNASESTLEKWEIGASVPTGAALKLLHVVQTHGLEVLT